MAKDIDNCIPPNTVNHSNSPNIKYHHDHYDHNHKYHDYHHDHDHDHRNDDDYHLELSDPALLGTNRLKDVGVQTRGRVELRRPDHHYGYHQ